MKNLIFALGICLLFLGACKKNQLNDWNHDWKLNGTSSVCAVAEYDLRSATCTFVENKDKQFSYIGKLEIIQNNSHSSIYIQSKGYRTFQVIKADYTLNSSPIGVICHGGEIYTY